MNKEVMISVKAKLDTSSSGITSINNDLKKIGSSVDGITLKIDKDSLKTAVSELKKLDNQAKESSKQARTWQYDWNKAFQSFTTYMSVSTIFYQIKNSIVAMVEEVMELDKALVEVTKVTDLSGESLDNFTKKAYDAAEGVAKTGTEMIQAATEFAKSGYDADASLELGKIALMYTNIADEAVSAGESAEFLIAQMKAFNTEDAGHIADVVNEVSNKFAVSSADIAKNLGKSSSVLANAGNSLEESVALLTAGTEITRSASRVSNGLKTITLRLQGMDDEGQKNLELTAQMEDLYQKLGISVYDANGEVKNTYELLKTLAPIYKEATTAEKAYITETIAGKYQAQNAAAILNNFNTAIAANEAGLNSQGSVMAENEKVLDSIEGKIKSFQSAFEELSQKLVGSDLIKFVVDLGTGALELVNSGFGQFTIKTLALTVAIGGTVSIIKKATDAIGGYNLITSKLLKTLIYFSDGEEALGKILSKNVKGYKELNYIQKQNYLNAEISSIKTTAQTVALTGLVAAINLAVMAYQKYKSEQAQIIQNAIDSSTELEENNKSLDDIISRVEENRKALEDYNISASEQLSINKELSDIQKDLIEQYGNQADGIDVVNGSIDEQINKLKDLKKANAEAWLDDNYGAIQTAEKYLEKDRSSNSMGAKYGNSYVGLSSDFESSEMIKNLEKLGAEFETNKGNLLLNVNGTIDEMISKYEEYYNATKKWAEENKKIDDADTKRFLANLNRKKKALEEDEDYKKYKKITDKAFENELSIAKGYDSFINDISNKGSTGDLNNKTFDEIIKKYPEVNKILKNNEEEIDNLIEKYQNVSYAIENALSKLNPEEFDNVTNSLYNLALKGELSEESVQNIIDKNDELKNALEETGGDAESLANYISNIYSAFDENGSDIVLDYANQLSTIPEKIEKINSAIEEFNEQGYISAETYADLASSGLLEYLNFTTNGLYANTDALYENANASKEKAIEDLKTATAQKLMQIAMSDVKEETNKASEKTAFESMLERVQQKALNAAKSALGAGVTIDGVFKSLEGQGFNVSGLSEETKAKMSSTIDEFNKYYNQINNMGIGSISTPKKSSRGSGSKSSSSSSQKEWWEIEFERLKDQFNYNESTIDEYIWSLDHLLGQLQKGTDAWRKVNEELQKQKLDKIEDMYKRGEISLSDYIYQLRQLAKAYREGTDAWNELADKIKEALKDRAEQQKDKFEEAQDAALDLIDDEIDKLNDLKDQQEEYYDKLIESKEKANEETQKEIDLMRLKDNLENARKEKTKRVWREGLGWVYETDQQAIKDAEDELNSFNQEQEIEDLEKQKEEAINNIEEQIDAWEKYKESWEAVTEDYEKEQAKLLLQQALGADAEAKILGQRLDVLEDFKNKYISTLKQIQEIENATIGQTSQDWFGSNFYVNNFKGYSNGGVVDYTGLAMLHGTPSNPEFVLNSRQMKNLYANIIKPTSALQGMSGGNNVYNFDKLVLPNVKNATDFINNLHSLVNITKNQ